MSVVSLPMYVKVAHFRGKRKERKTKPEGHQARRKKI